jgi:hypothetical protein
MSDFGFEYVPLRPDPNSAQSKSNLRHSDMLEVWGWAVSWTLAADITSRQQLIFSMTLWSGYLK